MREIERVNLPREIDDYVREQLKKDKEKSIKSTDIASIEAFPIENYEKLLTTIAEISYLNGDHNLLFRGQNEDYGFSTPSYKKKSSQLKKKSSLYPSIYREVLRNEIKKYRFSKLFTYSDKLVKNLSNLIRERRNIEEEIDKRIKTDIKRFQYLQWSLLQHYQITSTPLLDLTSSIDVALSFALLKVMGSETTFWGEGYLYVLGFPYLTNKITYNVEHDVVVIKLSSVLSPDALRPHRQKGYAVATLSLLENYEDKKELDFNKRLIMKFKIKYSEDKFWGKSPSFKLVPYNWLFPKNDNFHKNLTKIFSRIEREFPKYGKVKAKVLNDTIIEFFRLWSCIEKDKKLKKDTRLLNIKRYRNKLVHDLCNNLNYSNEELLYQLKEHLANLKDLIEKYKSPIMP